MAEGHGFPWSILGLNGGEATVRDVKRAYAALIKQKRPDTHPEEFRKIHDAYLAALQELAARDAAENGTPAVVVPMTETKVPAEAAEDKSELPAAFLAAAGKLRAAPDLKSAPAALAELRAACGEDASLWKARSRALCEIFDAQPAALALIATVVPASDILAELRAGAGESSLRILEAWHGLGFRENMIHTGKVLTGPEGVELYHHATCGLFALRLAFLLSISEPGGANLLLDAAFQRLPAPLRPHVTGPVEERLRTGRLFWHLPGSTHAFWEDVLDRLDAGGMPDWTSASSRRAVSELLRVTPSDWPGWAFLSRYLPERQWKNIALHYKNQPPGRQRWSPPPDKSWKTDDGSGKAAAPALPSDGNESTSAAIAATGAEEILAGPSPLQGAQEEPYRHPKPQREGLFRYPAKFTIPFLIVYIVLAVLLILWAVDNL